MADYIPALACGPDLFGVCVAGAEAGPRSATPITIYHSEHLQALYVRAGVRRPGLSEARSKLGVNSTGIPFDSVMAIELNRDRTRNPMVNAGALAATSLVPGATGGEKFENIVAGLSRFAGRPLVMDEGVYESRPRPISATGASPICWTATSACMGSRCRH